MAASGKAEDKALKTVQLEGHVVLKIIKHCREFMPALVTGQLLGLDVGQTLEVTDSFPFPSRGPADEEDGEGEGANYQLDMMRCLREVNVDNNTVGWYQSTVMGSYQTLELIDTFINYQESIKRCICIIFDPQQAAAGALGLKAVRLREAFMDVYKAGSLTSDKLKTASISSSDIFEEIPVVVNQSALSKAVIACLEPEAASRQASCERLSLGSTSGLERSLAFLNDCLEDVMTEQQKVTFYHRNFARQQQQLAQWQQKRRQENAARRAAGEDPLPEEDPLQFKPIPEPSPLDGMLITNQISKLCEQLHASSSQSLQKLYVVEGLQKA